MYTVDYGALIPYFYHSLIQSPMQAAVSKLSAFSALHFNPLAASKKLNSYKPTLHTMLFFQPDQQAAKACYIRILTKKQIQFHRCL